MSNGKKCKNYERCRRFIEPDRPKQARYCNECGANRSSDWKQEHPDKVASYKPDAAISRWREERDWNEYIQDWRDEHPEEYRQQNRRAQKAYRERQSARKEKAHCIQQHSAAILLIVPALVVALTLSPPILASAPETQELSSRIDVYKEMLIEFTVAGGLTFFCLRVLGNELTELLQSFKKIWAEAKKDGQSENHSKQESH